MRWCSALAFDAVLERLLLTAVDVTIQCCAWGVTGAELGMIVLNECRLHTPSLSTPTILFTTLTRPTLLTGFIDAFGPPPLYGP